MEQILPPGQHQVDRFDRFGTPIYATRLPTAARAELIVGGHTPETRTLGVADLEALRRKSVKADFHCVATWTFRNLHWEGWALKDVFDAFIAPSIRTPQPDGYIEFHAWDGYRTSLLLTDALASNVLVADRLDGQPLTLEHGAPLRLVAPDLYGYKNVKHLSRINLRPDFRAGRAERRTLAHPRGRVAFEERGRGLPGWVYRPIYRALIQPTLWYYRHFGRSLPSPDEPSSGARV